MSKCGKGVGDLESDFRCDILFELESTSQLFTRVTNYPFLCVQIV